MASAAYNQTIVAAAEVLVFNSVVDGGQCKCFLVGVRPASVVGVRVRVPGLHAGAEQLSIPAGASQMFEYVDGDGSGAINTVYLQGDGGVATVDYGVVSKSTLDG